MRNHRFLLSSCVLLATLAMTGPVPAAATHADRVDETAKTPTAVIAVDQHWTQAEVQGDTDWLDGMLLPQYRSVNVDGTFATKAEIVAHAAKRHGSKAMQRKVAAWRKAHPSRKKVTMLGNIAILSFVSTAPATKGKLYSSDIFVYVDGRWRALYSQHTDLGKS